MGTHRQERGANVSRVGLSTYAYSWHMSPRASAPYSLSDVLYSARDFGIDLVQICDHLPLEGASDDELDRIRAVADHLELTLEVGTKGIQPERLRRYLTIAQRLEARIVRTMLRVPGHHPDVDECVELLRTHAPRYASAGVSLAVETYEQVSTADLVDVITRVDSSAVGICGDPSNTIAILEQPAQVIDLIAPLVNNLHVKDFEFRRRDDNIGFELIGAPLGSGLLPVDQMYERIDPLRRGISQVIEQWLPWQGTPDATLRAENDWNRTAVEFLKHLNAREGTPA